METKKHELFLKEEVYAIVGCAMEVLNELGHGLLEKRRQESTVRLKVHHGGTEDTEKKIRQLLNDPQNEAPTFHS